MHSVYSNVFFPKDTLIFIQMVEKHSQDVLFLNFPTYQGKNNLNQLQLETSFLSISGDVEDITLPPADNVARYKNLLIFIQCRCQLPSRPRLEFGPVKIKKDQPSSKNWLKLGINGPNGQNWSKLKFSRKTLQNQLMKIFIA